MPMTGVEPVFLDTNVLVYANVAESPLHAESLAAIETLYATNVALWLSRQVLREFIVVLSRPQVFSQPRPMSTLIQRVKFLQSRFQVAEDGPMVTAKLLALLSEVSMGGKQVHDANIVATMQAHGSIPRLLTHNTNDFTRYAHVITVLPLCQTL